MNIYVGNLSRTVTEDALKQAFEQYGEVISVKMIKDKFTGEARGFAFVDMPNAEAAEMAMTQMNGRDMDGLRLRVNEAREPEDRPRTGTGNRFGSSSNGPRRPYGDRNSRSSNGGGMGFGNNNTGRSRF